MKTIKEAALEYAEHEASDLSHKSMDDLNICDLEDYIAESFKEGVEFSQRWIPVEEELPKLGNDGYSKNVLVCDDPQDEDDARICYARKNFLTGKTIWKNYERPENYERPAYWRPINLK